MKQIINGKKYDTETAEMIGGTYYYGGSYDYQNEELYRKKTGEFFLYGEGGPNSAYAKHYRYTRTSSSCILPYSISEAKEWVMENMSADSYERLFGEVEE